MSSNRGSKPGERRGGRQKGVPNKVTADVRQVFAGIMERNAAKCEAWIEQVAETDPFKATDLLLRLAEYHIPKLARSEVTGKDGGAIIVKAASTDEGL